MWAIVALPVLLALAAIPPSLDGLADVKLLAGLLAVLLAGRRWLWSPPDEWPRRPLGAPGWVLAAFVVAATLATLASDVPMLSVIGADQRHNGLVGYGVAAALLMLVASAMSVEDLGRTARSLALGGALAVGYWGVQLAGWDPLGIQPATDAYNVALPFYATIGNPNFAGAFVAIALPASVWATLGSSLSRRARAGWLAVTGLLVWGVLGSASLQAPLAALAGLSVLGLAFLAGRSRRAFGAALRAGAIIVVVTTLGLAQTGPLAALGRQETFVSRTWDWTAAVRMAADHPVTGVGPGRFSGYVRQYRPPGDIVQYGWLVQADAAHSVPLDLAAGGGLPLLAAYAGLVGLVGWRLLRGLYRLEGDRLLLLGAFGGMWAAYQAQSLVSIDMSYLLLLHFLAAGGILAVTAPPAADTPAVPPGRPARICVSLAGLLALVVMLRVTGAEFAAGLADVREDSDPAVIAPLHTAIAWFPWQPNYWSMLGDAYDAQGQTEAALRAYRRATHGDPRNLFFVFYEADAAERTGRPELALKLLRRMIQLEPQAAEPKIFAAEAALRRGHGDEADRLLRAALAFAPDHAMALRLQREWADRR